MHLSPDCFRGFLRGLTQGLLVLTVVTLSACARSPDPASPRGPVTITQVSQSGLLKESLHDYQCPSDQIMTGRYHWGDENRPTEYFCSKAEQFGRLPIKNLRKTANIKESDGIRYSCNSNEVMTGRGHNKDENGTTWYYCGTPYDYWGNPVQIVRDTQWIRVDNEEEHRHVHCPTDKVMVARWHDGDEQGPTEYLCATLY